MKKETLLKKYSVDKIKLEFKFIRLDSVQDFLNKLSEVYDKDLIYYESKAMTKCKHNFMWNLKEGNIYIGVVPNWKKEEKEDKSIILEYNPNKIDAFSIKQLYWLKFQPSCNIRVMSFDIAVDLPIDYGEVRMLKRDKREYQCDIGHSRIETRYLGELGHNHVKLYDKAREQKLDGISWTRFEITVKEINSPGCTLEEFENTINLPVLYRMSSQIDIATFQLNDTTRIVLEAIIRDINLLYTIKKYDTRKKYEKMLGEHMQAIDISVREMYLAYRDYWDNLSTKN